MKFIILIHGCLIFYKYLRGNIRRYENTIGDIRVKYQKSADVYIVDGLNNEYTYY